MEEAKRVFLVVLQNYGAIRVAEGYDVIDRFYFLADWKYDAYEDYSKMYSDCLEISQRLFGGYVDRMGHGVGGRVQ